MTLLDDLSLEIEVPGSGLPNLAQNPSGELGSWGYVTPVSTTNLVSLGTALQFSVTASAPSCFTTEFVPIAASQYAASRLQLISTTASHNIRIRYEWYDANKALLSSSVQSTTYSTAGTRYGPTAQAPASTVYMKMRIDFYNGGGNPSVSAAVQLAEVMLTKSASGTVTSSQTNLIRNPSFETNASYWVGTGVASISRQSTYAHVGSWSLRCHRASGAASDVMTIAYRHDNTSTATLPVTAGKEYRFSFYVRSAVARNAQAVIGWYNPTTMTSTQVSGSVTATTTGGFTRLQVAGTAPVGVTLCTPQVQVNAAALNEYHYIDAALFEESATTSTYFDGAQTASGYVLAWTGTAHASTSTKTSNSSTFDYSEPVYWTSILGPTSSIQVNRSALDTGTLSAEILDANLDPAFTSTIRQGKRIRLLARTSADEWEPLFTGRVSTAKTDYRKAKGGSIDDKGAVRISLTATDNISSLASQGESRGVATVEELAYLLEGKSTPWKLNGNGNQIGGSPSVVSLNDNASILDQVAVTRDTVLGYAWVDKWNVLTVNDATEMSGTVVASFSDASGSPLSYTDISTDFDLSDLTNVVTVNWLRMGVDGSTETIVYGPYRSESSIAEYGAYGRVFTIQGVTEDANTIATYAQSILTANATPLVTCRSLTMLVDDDDTRDAAIALDLYSPVEVEYADRIDTTIRVTGLTHTITPDRWNVVLSLNPTTTVASPQVTPSPTNPSDVDTGWLDLTLASNWTDAGFGWQDVQYRRIGTNLYLRGLAGRITSASGTNATIATLPVGFRPVAFNPLGTAYYTGTTSAFTQLSLSSTGAILTTVSVPSGSYVPLTAGPISLS